MCGENFRQKIPSIFTACKIPRFVLYFFQKFHVSRHICPRRVVYIGEGHIPHRKEAFMILNDFEIVSLYHARNQQAVEITQKQYGTYCHTVSMNILNSQPDAEECVNDTWVAAWNTMPPQVAPESLRLPGQAGPQHLPQPSESPPPREAGRRSDRGL